MYGSTVIGDDAGKGDLVFYSILAYVYAECETVVDGGADRFVGPANCPITVSGYPVTDPRYVEFCSIGGDEISVSAINVNIRRLRGRHSHIS